MFSLQMKVFFFNTDMKIISEVLSARIKNVLPFLIKRCMLKIGS